MKKIIRTALFILCLAVLAFSSYKVIDYHLQESESTALLDDTKDTFIKVHGDALNIDFDALIATHPHIVGWLYQPGTNINYPIVQSDDNEYYLRRLLDGSHNMNGSLFMDYRSAGDFSHPLSVIYGHNMKNGEMFATFPNYAEQEYFSAHPNMLLYTPNGDFEIRLIAGFLTDDTDMVYSYFNDGGASSEEILNYALEKSAFDAGMYDFNDERLVVLSTCSYEKSNSRFILVGVLKETIPNP